MKGARRLQTLVILAGCLAVVAMGAAGALAGPKLKTKSVTIEVDGDERGSGTATCKKGAKAISGGFEAESGGPFFQLEDSSKSGGRNWTVAADNVQSDAGDLTAHAYCRNEKVKRRSETVFVEPNEFGTISATCKQGTKAISGGFEAEGFLMGHSRLVGKRTWAVRGINADPDPEALTAQVNCRDGKGLKTAQSFDDEGAGEVDASCGRKQRVVSGGFAHPDSYFYPLEFLKVGKRTWHLAGDGLTDVAVYAYCEKK